MKKNLKKEALLKKSKEELIDYFLEIIEELNSKISLLEKENKALKSKLNLPKKDSSNSSKPPSTDHKANNKTSKSKSKKKGPPFGHKSHHKKLSNNPDQIKKYDLEYCPECSNYLDSSSKCYITRQYIELKEIKIEIIEERRQYTTCPCCKKTVYASGSGIIPSRKYIGPYLKTFLGLLHYQSGVSRGKLQDLIDTYSNHHLSIGAINKIMEELSDVTAVIHNNLKKEVRESSVIGADETGWRVNGENQWAWVFQNEDLTFYIIKPSRGSKVPKAILGDDFNGILVSDFYSSYSPVNAYKKGKCNQHLIRDLKFGMNSEDENGFCHKMLNIILDGLALRKLKEQCPYMSFRVESDLLDRRINKQLKRIDISCEAKKLKNRIIKYREDIFLFLNDLKVPPTNNGSEQAMRKIVIHRKRSNGSRSDKGALGMSRIMSVIETCRKRSLNIVEIIKTLFQNTDLGNLILKPG